MRSSSYATVALVLGTVLALAGDVPASATAPSPLQAGAFGTPFAEPGPNCPADADNGQSGDGPAGPTGTPCKPAAVTQAVLAGGSILYWDGLAGMENVALNTTAEFGQMALCDQSRVLSLAGTPTWSVPKPADGTCGAGYQPTYLVPNPPAPLQPILTTQGKAPDALFCSSPVFLANGRLVTVGGTDYYNEPAVPGTPYGVVELEGTRSTRIFNPADGTWQRLADMHYGRWYPSLVTLPSGDLLVASGVTKLLKPVYPNQPQDSLKTVEQTETFSLATGTWTYNGPAADQALPLYPRLHLLPDGKIYFDAGGQVYNPFGQSIDEAKWNWTSVYDPATKAWTQLGIPGFPGTAPGFRGSTFSIMLPLRPPYTSASFLTAGGVLGVTPGTYVATTDSRIATVDTARGDAFSWKATGPLNNRRWYTTGVQLPDGTVFAVSGADRDEVVQPGSGFPVHQAEIFNPATGQWTAVASDSHDRTYHNTAVLLPTGQVLVGGHSPINNGYGSPSTTPGGFSNNFRDATFEVYNPPYLYRPGRPVIRALSSPYLGYGHKLTIETGSARSIQKVMLVRNTSLTHLVDADQRTVELPIVSRNGSSITVLAPPRSSVAPAGPYLLFIDSGGAGGLVPSVAAQVFVTG